MIELRGIREGAPMNTLEELKQILKDRYSLESIQPTDLLLGQPTGKGEFDSLDLVEFGIDIEDKFQMEIEDHEMRRVTLGEIVTIVDQRKGSKSGTKKSQ